MVKLLDGVRVLEVASWTYVPAAGAVLAEWGADVLKIEHPETGDPQRGLVSSGLLGAGTVDFTVQLPNRGKRSVGLDMSTDEGHDLLLRLAAGSDVFLTSFLPSARHKLRIDVDDIRAVNPNIIYVRGSALGQRGPEAHRGGYDFSTYWGRAGSSDTATRATDDYPVGQPGGAYGDVIGGLTIAGGICAALLHRDRTGEALLVDSSLLAMGAWATGFSIAGANVFGLERLGGGTRYDSPNPLVGTYKTKDDRFISIVLMQSDRFWPDFVERLGHSTLQTDPRFASAASRVENKRACIELLDEAFAMKTLAEWKAALADFEGVWAPVQTVREVANDPQVIANGYIRDVVDADGQAFKLVAAPVQFDETPSELSRAPAHGEHTDEVLLELGLDMDQLLDLKMKGAIL
ncbi:MAG TPA: CoA transferase [Acidimicrobiales bacterium]|nr:CoA transferase [Acidimicrobiales bacterium]